MSAPEQRDLLRRLLATSVSEFHEVHQECPEPLPESWAKPLAAACMEPDRDSEHRVYLLELLGTYSDRVLAQALEDAGFYIDSGILHDHRQTGDLWGLNYELDRLLPGYRYVASVNRFVEAYLHRNLRLQAEIELSFHGIDSAALDWIDNPDMIPEAYAEDGKCATCAHYRPMEAAEGGVLGECGLHTAKLGLFRQDASCDEWVKR